MAQEQLKSNLFMVISPHQEDYEPIEEYVKENIEDLNFDLVIKENGKEGTHPHLNCLLYTGKRPDNYRKWFIQHHLREVDGISSDSLISSHLVSCRPITGLTGILNYLSKEDNYELIHAPKDFKMPDRPKILNYKSKERWNYIPSVVDFPHCYIKYCEDHCLDAYKSLRCIRDVLKCMTRDGICILPIMKRLPDILIVLHMMLEPAGPLDFDDGLDKNLRVDRN